MVRQALKSAARRAARPAHQAASYSRRASASSIGHGLFTSNRVCFIASLASIGMSSFGDAMVAQPRRDAAVGDQLVEPVDQHCGARLAPLPRAFGREDLGASSA